MPPSTITPTSASPARDDAATRPDPLRFTWSRTGAALTLHVSGEVDLATEAQLREAVDLLVLSCASPVVDLRDAFLDVRGVDVLLTAAVRLSAEQRCLLALCSADQQRILQLCGACPGLLLTGAGG